MIREYRHAQAIVNHAPEAILFINKRGLILSLNPAAEEMFGYLCTEILNAPITKLLAEPPSPNRTNLLHESVPVGTVLGLAAGGDGEGVRHHWLHGDDSP